MSDINPLDFLRDQFSLLHTKLDVLGDDLLNLKVRTRTLETNSAEIRGRLDEVKAMLSKIDGRLGSIDRRFPLQI